MSSVSLKNVSFACLALIGLSATPTLAQVDIINNLSQPASGAFASSDPAWSAAAFNTGTQAYTLTAVVLPVGSKSGAAASVYLYSSSGANQPGTNLGLIGTSGPLGPGVTNTTFTPATTFSLLANTDYWLIARSAGNLGWGFTSSTSYTGSGSIPAGFARANTTNSGATWTTQPLGGSVAAMKAQVIGTLASSVSSAPEPGTLALLALGGVVVLAKRRRRQS